MVKIKKTAVFLIIALVLALSACLRTKDNTPEKSQSVGSPITDATQTQRGITPTTAPVNQDTPGSKNGASNDDKLITVIAAYSGRIDSHSIEVKIESTGEFAEFSILEIQDSFKELSKNQRIRITYELGSYGQKTIKEITPLK